MIMTMIGLWNMHAKCGKSHRRTNVISAKVQCVSNYWAWHYCTRSDFTCSFIFLYHKHCMTWITEQTCYATIKRVHFLPWKINLTSYRNYRIFLKISHQIQWCEMNIFFFKLKFKENVNKFWIFFWILSGFTNCLKYIKRQWYLSYVICIYFKQHRKINSIEKLFTLRNYI